LRIRRKLIASQNHRMQNHAERFADRLVTPTLALAASTAAVTGDFNRFLSLVIVDYGTGIRVAAPTSVLSSMTHAARAGMIIKSGGRRSSPGSTPSCSTRPAR
jgi:Cu2+-exporting ATPase